MNIISTRIQRLLGRHAMVGIICALLNISIIYIFTEILVISYFIAVIITVFTTIPISYFIHRKYTFRLDRAANLREFIRFLGQQIFQFSLGFVLLIINVEWIGLNPTLGMIVATLMLWILSFITQWFWVFGTKNTIV